jgi:hypothetical protein
MEIGYCRYTSFVLRQDIDANPFVITNTIVFGVNILLTEKSILMQIHMFSHKHFCGKCVHCAALGK